MNNDIAHFLGSQIDRDEYVAWKNDPKTQHFIRMVEQLNRPLGVTTMDPNVNAGLYNQQVGINAALEQLQTLDTLLVPGEMPRDDYGVDEVLSRWGRKQTNKESGS